VKEMFMRMLHEGNTKWKKCLWECYMKYWVICIKRCEGERNVYENVTWRKYKVKEMFMIMLHEILSDLCKDVWSERNVYENVTWIIEWYVLRCEGERNVYGNVT
jgi:hypothetical protein